MARKIDNNVIFSSPIFYVLMGYLAGGLCLTVQGAVVAGSIVVGSFIFYTLSFVLLPATLLCPLMAVALAMRHVYRRVRRLESIAAIIGAIPMVLLWYAALSRANALLAPVGYGFVLAVLVITIDRRIKKKG